MFWVIRFNGSIHAWIANPERGYAFRTVFEERFAHRFPSGEDARDEMLRLGLSTRWSAVQLEAQ